MKSLIHFFYGLAILGLTLPFQGCRSSSDLPTTDSPPSQISGATFYENRLLDIIEQEKQLDQLAQNPQSDRSDLERRFQNIARDYNSLIADNPNQIEVRLLYGKLLSRYGDSEGARDAFLAAAQIDPNIAVIHQQLGNFFAEEGDPTRALAYYLNAVEIEPNEALYHFGLGDLIYVYRDELIQEGGLNPSLLDEKMMNAFQTAANLDPSNPIFHFRFGEAFYDIEKPNWEKALNHWNQVLQFQSLSDIQRNAVFLHQSRCLLGLERYDEAIDKARQVDLPGLIQTRITLIDRIREAKSTKTKNNL